MYTFRLSCSPVLISRCLSRGLFSRSSAPIITTSASIVIDKHELHSAWPVYTKRDEREMEKDGLVLTAERSNTCYGPNDPVLVRLTARSNTGTATIKTYEMALRESAVFRRGPAAGSKPNQGPQVRSTFIGSDRRMVQVPLRPGISNSIELSCIVPSNHMTTSIVTAQHIEVVYNLAVRALLEGGGELVIDNIPVMISNWSR